METARILLEDIAHFFGAPSPARNQLDLWRGDRVNAETEIRSVLDRLANKYDVPRTDVEETMNSIGVAIGDMTYEPEMEYLEEIESQRQD